MLNTVTCLRTLGRRTLAILGLGFLSVPLVCTAPLIAAEAPTGRRTTDRAADLIAALIEARQTDAAAEICQRHLATAAPGSAPHAAWSIRLSAVRAAALQAAGSDDDAAWAAARQPVEQAAAGYETQAAAPWLELQRLLVGLARSDQRVMRYLANPADSAARDGLLEELRSTIDGLRALDARLAEMIPLADAGRLPTAAPPQDLIRLQHTVRRRIVEALLLRGDVYPAESEDALAAATEAEGIAASLMDIGTTDADTREAALRAWAEAQRRAGNPAAAIQRLSEWVSASGSAAPETLAQLVLAELQSGDRAAAESWLQSFYGDTPTAAPASVEMDLARMRYLIAGNADTSEDRQRIATWIEQIEQRHGAYARRRAEAEMLRVVRVQPTEGNATLMAAQAGQLLRSGDEDQILQAAQLLHQASVAAGNTPDGFRWGLQAAAALAKLGRHGEASRWFAETAARSPDQPQASAAHFAAARQLSLQIAAQSTSANMAPSAAELTGRLESLLADHLRRWPQSAEAAAAREWLVKILEASHRFAEAAEAVLQLPAESVEWPNAIRRSGQYWRQALAAVDTAAERQPIALRAISGWDAVPPPYRPLADEEANLAAALALDRETLRASWREPASIDSAPDSQPLDRFGGNRFAGGLADDLRRVRLEGIDPTTVALSPREVSDPGTMIDLGLRRLREDAQSHPSDAERMGRAMLRMVEGSAAVAAGAEPLQEHPLVADALALAGQWQQAAERWERRAGGSPPDPEALRNGAMLLGSLRNPAAIRRAIEMWSRLAQGLPQGSPEWHQARLGAARLHKRIGQDQEAAKLARFVLLTQPPQDSALKTEYQRLATGD